MRQIVFHRHAAKYLQKMPVERKSQTLAALRELAALPDPAASPNVRRMAGEWSGAWRLHISSYRVIFTFTTQSEPGEGGTPQGVLEALLIGPRGDIYK